METQLVPNIDWVGAIDWNVRDFHSYTTNRGATYNSYLIRDTEPAIIDTVKGTFFAQHLNRVSALVDPAKVRYIVCNHAEPDHSSGLPMAAKAFPNAVFVMDQKCLDTVSKYYDATGWNVKVVKTGDEIKLGSRTLKFIETPMVHWPDSMFTYVPEEKLLFSMDAFGQHLASGVRFDDEIDLGIVMDEAKTYYANIVVPYSQFVAKTLEAAKTLDITMIAPSHGVIWRKNLDVILKAYQEWAAGTIKPRVVVLYDSMWDSTAMMAEAITEGVVQSRGVNCSIVHVRRSDLTRVATELLDVAAFAFGSSTLNGTMMPAAAAALTYIKGMRLTGKSCFAFGSSGWAGKGGPDQVEAMLKESKFDILRAPVKCTYRPTKEVLDECVQAGKLLGEIAAKSLPKR